LLRPPQLVEARKDAKDGKISGVELQSIQDLAIREIVGKQEALGLKVVTDGEFRRDWWHIDFLVGLDGVTAIEVDPGAVRFQGSEEQPPIIHVNGKIQHRKPIFVEHFLFLKSIAKATAKLTIPAPAMLYHRGGRSAISKKIYPNLEEMWIDAAAAYAKEIQALAAAGCTYLQIDDVSFAYLCDEKYRDSFRANGDDPDQLLRAYTNAINLALKDRPNGMTVAMHTCRGNFKSTWVANGGYEPVADVMFNKLNVDAYFLEFDTDRAGGFEPLRFVPKGKKVVLGLVTTKRAELESKESLKRRIGEASKFVPVENLCLSPQCGFSSTHHGNNLSTDDQWRKLDLIAITASEVWN